MPYRVVPRSFILRNQIFERYPATARVYDALGYLGGRRSSAQVSVHRHRVHTNDGPERERI